MARLRIFALILIAVLVTGTLGFMALEDLTFFESFYFTVVTVATVGYGDITASTHAGRVLAMILMLTGVGTFLGVVANGTEALLNKRENALRAEKLHMVIGVFFSEAGTGLLRLFAGCDPKAGFLKEALGQAEVWPGRQAVMEKIKEHDFRVVITRDDIARLREYLRARSDLILRLYENPYLHEHESFTELLRALLHLKEEVLLREAIAELPDADCEHVAGDAKRVYAILVPEWVAHVDYLKGNYPYLFSLAVRTNPFNPEASVVVR